MEETINTRQLSEMLPERPKPATIREWVNENKIPCLPRKEGARMYFYPDAIQYWLDNKRPEKGEMSDVEYSKLGM
jgi:hypothetical protein